MSDPWTIRRILEWTAKDFAERGLDSPRLDAELLIAEALGCDRLRLYLDLDRPLDAAERTRVRELVARRRKREPIAYITGRRDFWSRSFTVTPAVLVPRPDTETLVERALALLPPGAPARVLDLCTGSGIIAVTLAAERPELSCDATDISPDALEVARTNAGAHGVADRVALFAGDLFEPVRGCGPYDLVTANPPYIPEGEVERLAPEITQWEPRLAVAAGGDGLAVVSRIAREAPAFLRDAGTLLVEVGAGQSAAVAALFEGAGLAVVARHRDLSGIERVVEARAQKR